MTEPPRPGEGGHGAPSPDPTMPSAPYSTPGQPSAAGGYPTPEAPRYDSAPEAPRYDQPTSGGYADTSAGYSAPPGGYGPPAGDQSYPPAGGYGTPGGYGATPGGYGAPTGYANNDEKTWALLAHFGGIVLGFIAPLIAMLVKGNESTTVRAHSVEALNFQITWGIATILASVLGVCSFGILFFLPMLTWAVVIIFSVIAGVKANDGVLYRYPMTVRMIK